MDALLRVTFSGLAQMKLVQGEDRKFTLAFTDETTQLPYNLAGTAITASFARQGVEGGAVKARSGVLQMPGGYTQSARASIFAAPSHGLVGGEQVTVHSVDDAVLPFPLGENTVYGVEVVTVNSLLLTEGVTPIKFSGALPNALQIEVQPGIVVTDENLGLATLSLSAKQTRAMAYGLGADMQFTLTAEDGTTRVVVCVAALDVVPQPWP